MEEKTLQTMEPTSISEAKTQAALAEINFDDPMLTVNYGAKTLGEIAKFTDSVLSNVRVKDATAVGQALDVFHGDDCSFCRVAADLCAVGPHPRPLSQRERGDEATTHRFLWKKALKQARHSPLALWERGAGG